MPQISKQAREEWFHQPIEIKSELEQVFDKFLPQITVLDIGACEGLSSLRYAYNGIGGRFIMFEPLPGNVQLIQDNIKTFSSDVPGRFDVMPFALGANTGKQRFWISHGTLPGIKDWNVGNKSSSLLPPKEHKNEHKWCNFLPSDVSVSTLDSLQLDADFIHLDVQGGEMLVLQGGERTISNARAAFVEVATIELYAGQPIDTDIIQWFITRKFKIAKEMYVHHRRWGDLLFVR